jgi:hypothetical protein
MINNDENDFSEGGGYSRTREPLHMKRLSYEEWQKGFAQRTAEGGRG